MGALRIPSRTNSFDPDCYIRSVNRIDIGGGLSKPNPPRPEVFKPARKLPENMERGLHERDRVGVQDFVLLEDFRSESAFIDNLRKRFKEDLIYVSRKYIINTLRERNLRERKKESSCFPIILYLLYFSLF